MMGSRFKDRQLGLIKQLVFFACYNPLADLVSLHSLRVAGKFSRQTDPPSCSLGWVYAGIWT